MDTVVVERNALERAIVFACSIVLWVTTLVIFVILSANTALRYASGSSLQWANEVPELLFPWLVMAGVVLAAEKGSHIATVFLVDSVGAGARRIIAVVSWDDGGTAVRRPDPRPPGACWRSCTTSVRRSCRCPVR